MLSAIDLNCDLGEYDDWALGYSDAKIMPLISSCNIACGAHAGNQQVIDQTITTAKVNQVNIGAHPSYPDRTHFGRQVMHLPAKELVPILRDQIGLIQASARTQNVSMMHVKPHGALYNQAAIDLALALILAETIAECIVEFGQNLMFYGLAHSAMAQAAKQVGIQFVAEGFIDRGYTASRTLQTRGESGAIIDDPVDMLQRVLGILKTGQITAVSGEPISLLLETLCLHGDHDNSFVTAQSIHQGLLAANISVQAPALVGIK